MPICTQARSNRLVRDAENHNNEAVIGIETIVFDYIILQFFLMKLNLRIV